MDRWLDRSEPDPERAYQKVVNRLYVNVGHERALDHGLKSPHVHLLVLFCGEANWCLFKLVHDIDAVTWLVFKILTYLNCVVLCLFVFKYLKLLKDLESEKPDLMAVLQQVTCQTFL